MKENHKHNYQRTQKNKYEEISSVSNNNQHTFIISNNVLNTISIIMKYSNGVDTTIRQILYLKLFRLLGMYRSNGRAPIVKSMQDFWN